MEYKQWLDVRLLQISIENDLSFSLLILVQYVVVLYFGDLSWSLPSLVSVRIIL